MRRETNWANMGSWTHSHVGRQDGMDGGRDSGSPDGSRARVLSRGAVGSRGVDRATGTSTDGAAFPPVGVLRK